MDLLRTSVPSCCQSGFSSQIENVWRKTSCAAEILEDRPAQTLGDSSIYSGQWRGSVPHGYGRLSKPVFGIYTGQFVQGRMCGEGRLEKEDGDVYACQWLDDLQHGTGKLSYADGDCGSFEGRWQRGEKTGFGKEVVADGSTYEGAFVKDQRHGDGKYVAADGSSFEGQFRSDVIDGEGQHHFADGRVYVGQWKGSKMTGKGRMEWPNGQSYDGDFADGRKHGAGFFLWPDGRQYYGQWHLGRQHGQGNFTNAEGRTWSGRWHQGQRLKPGGESDITLPPSDPAESGREFGTSATQPRAPDNGAGVGGLLDDDWSHAPPQVPDYAAESRRIQTAHSAFSSADYAGLGDWHQAGSRKLSPGARFERQSPPMALKERPSSRAQLASSSGGLAQIPELHAQSSWDSEKVPVAISVS